MALQAFGNFTYEETSPPVRPDTIFDLASLTKVVVTTPVCMLLHDRGRLSLEQRLMELLPSFRSDDPRKEQVTIRMLLAHSSGLPGYVRFFETARSRDELLHQALRLPLAWHPGTHAEYSDVGFILLGAAIEKLLQEPLDQFWQHELVTPLGIKAMMFCPPVHLRSIIPPSQDGQLFRERVIKGEVNDENAWVMGGAAPHAGCFATAADVAFFAQCMLDQGRPLFNPRTVELFTRRETTPAGTSRALGWDTPSSPSSSGTLFSARSYGHLGFTGTSLWIDPERQLSVTLLTNRTWPDRRAEGIKKIRPAFHDAVVQALH